MPATVSGALKSEDFIVPGKRSVSDDQETRFELSPRKPPRSEGVVTDGIVMRAPVISIDDIYRAPEAGTKLSTVLRLLREGVSNCNEALSALANDEPIEADALMLKVRTTLPELFCCRDIGDGFAEIINAVQSAFENLDGRMFSSDQVRAVKSVLAAVRNEPRMSFEKSLGHVSTLEDVGLKSEPSDIDKLAGWLDE